MRKKPETLGGHLRKRRHDLGFLQKEAAAWLGVNQWTLIGWERDRTEPSVRLLPKILAFLGYDLQPTPETLKQRIAAKRRSLGLSQRELADILNVNETTLWFRERDRRRPKVKRRLRIERFLGPGEWLAQRGRSKSS